jgi:hypothetical protein
MSLEHHAAFAPMMVLEGSPTANRQFMWRWEALTLVSTLLAVPLINAAMKVSRLSLHIHK